MTKRFVVAWDTGAIAGVYAVAVTLSYLLKVTQFAIEQFEMWLARADQPKLRDPRRGVGHSVSRRPST
jgi:hypothetical protein